MPVQAQYNARSGGNKFLLLANTMCRLVRASGPIIRVRYADRPSLLAVLTAAESVCELLPAAMDEQATMDAMPAAAFNPSDATIIPGQKAP